MRDDIQGQLVPASAVVPAQSIPAREVPYGYDEGEQEISLLRIAQILWRRKTFIIAVTLMLIVAALLVVSQLTPRYTAEVLIHFNPPETKFVNMDAVVAESDDGSVRSSDEAIQTEIEILKSRDLAETVIKDVGMIDKWRERDAEESATSWGSIIGDWLLSVVAVLPEDVAKIIDTFILGRSDDLDWVGEATDSDAGGDPVVMAEAVELFGESLRVSRAGLSKVLKVSFTDEDRVLARDAANALSDAYIDLQLQAKTAATRLAETWLTDQVHELRGKVRTSREAAEAYRDEFGLVEDKDFDTLKQDLAEVNGQLIEARVKSAEAEQNITFFRSILKAEDLESLILQMPTPTVEILFKRAAELKVEKAKVDALYSFDHPTLAAIAQESDEIRKFILLEARGYLESLKKSLSVDQRRVARLEQDVETLKERIAGLGKAKVELHSLESEADANQAMFEAFLTRSKEASLQQEIQQADARIVSRAVIPIEPSWPKKGLILGISGLLSVFVAVGLALLLENLEKGYRGLEELEREVGVAGLGIVPNIKAFSGRSSAADFVLERPNSAYSESLRSCHTGVLLSNVDTPARSLLVTSSVPGEGKTTFAIGLARLLAKGGSRVLLIDADLRKSQLHKVLEANKGPGLVDVLLDGIHWEDAVQTDERSGLKFLTAGDIKVPSPQDVLGSDRMGNLVFELSQELDLVIIDSPPAMAVSDASVILQHVDRAVYMVRWAETPRDIVAQGLKQLRVGRSKVAGVVLSLVDLKKNAQYGYSGSAYYYYGKYSKYYNS